MSQYTKTLVTLDEEAAYVYALLRAGNSLREVVLLSRYKYPNLRGVALGSLVGRMLNLLTQERLHGNSSFP